MLVMHLAGFELVAQVALAAVTHIGAYKANDGASSASAWRRAFGGWRASEPVDTILATMHVPQFKVGVPVGTKQVPLPPFFVQWNPWLVPCSGTT